MTYFTSRFVLPFSVFMTALLWAFSASALEEFKEFKRDHWDWELGGSYFASEANYDSSGNKQNLVSGNTYTLANFSLGTRYIPAREWSVFAIGNVGYSVAKNSVATRTNSSLSSALLGADFLMYSGGIDVVPEFSLLIPFEKVDETADSSLNSEGAVEGRARVTLQKNFGYFRGYTYLGVVFRDQERSFLMPWGVGGQIPAGSAVLGAELSGYQSISDDKDKKDSTRRIAYLNTVNAGSFAFYSVNPSVMNASLSAQVPFNERWQIKAFAGTTLAGSNSAMGYFVGGFLRYTFDLTQGYVQDHDYEPVSSPVPKGRSNLYFDSNPTREVHGFQEDTNDGVDQNLFKLKPAASDKKAPSKNQLQKQLDQTEFDIELKSKKKKKK